MNILGVKAKQATGDLSQLNLVKRNSVLNQFAQYLKINSDLILKENKRDLFIAKSKKIKQSMIDRLRLDEKKFKKLEIQFKK